MSTRTCGMAAARTRAAAITRRSLHYMSHPCRDPCVTHPTARTHGSRPRRIAREALIPFHLSAAFVAGAHQARQGTRVYGGSPPRAGVASRVASRNACMPTAAPAPSTTTVSAAASYWGRNVAAARSYCHRRQRAEFPASQHRCAVDSRYSTSAAGLPGRTTLRHLGSAVPA